MTLDGVSRPTSDLPSGGAGGQDPSQTATRLAARFQCVCFIVVTNVGQVNRRVGCPVNGMLVYPLSGVN